MLTKYPLKKVGSMAGVIASLMAAYFVVQWIREPFGPAEIIQGRQPVSLASTRRLIRLPLPHAASNIRFAHFQQCVAYETFVRFEAPPAGCVAFAERVIAEASSPDAKPGSGRLAKLGGPVDHLVASTSLLNTDWFDVQSIRQGLEGGFGPHRDPEGRIDAERGVR